MFTKFFSLAVVVESLLIMITTLLVAQPQKIFEDRSAGVKKFAFFLGCFCLLITFIWSVALGITISQIRIRL